MLRWRRKGVGLRGFRPDPINPPQVPEAAVQEEEEEDIAKVFRKQKVDGAVEEAVSRVLSMVDSPGARQQYRRMIERYREAKVYHTFSFAPRKFWNYILIVVYF